MAFKVLLILLFCEMAIIIIGMPISSFGNDGREDDLQRVIEARNALTPLIVVDQLRQSNNLPAVKDNKELYSLLIGLLVENQRIRKRAPSGAAMFNAEQSEMLQGLANHLSARVRPG